VFAAIERVAATHCLTSSVPRRLRETETPPTLFDTGRFCRGIEAAYTKMWEIWQTGETPESFAPLTRTNAASSQQLHQQSGFG
jgi:hypothetical protein